MPIRSAVEPSSSYGRATSGKADMQNLPYG